MSKQSRTRISVGTATLERFLDAYLKTYFMGYLLDAKETKKDKAAIFNVVTWQLERDAEVMRKQGYDKKKVLAHINQGRQ